MNPKYKYETKLPTIRVDRFLLEALEDYCIDKIPELIKTPKKTIKETIAISIKDNFGQEELGSIQDYPLRTFPNDTKEIRFNVYWSNYEKAESARIWIWFETESARLTVEIEGKNPKEIATGISNSIVKIIDQNKTTNRIFHPSIGIAATLSSLGFLSLMLGSNLIMKSLQYGALFLSIALFIGMYFWVFKKLKPYSAFDTLRQARINKTTSWFFYGLLSFLIFGNLFVFLKDFLFGD